jgi:hypothetical protein
MPKVILNDDSGHPILKLADDGQTVLVLDQVIGHIYSNRTEGAIAAIANLLTVQVPHAADRTYEIAGNVRPTTSTTHAFTMTCTYTDEGGTSRTLTMCFTLVAGGSLVTSIANANGAVPYMGVPQRIRCKKGTTIVFATTGTFTTVTYNAEASCAVASN